MNIKEKLAEDLIANGFNNEEAVVIITTLVVSTTGSIKSRWEENIDYYPVALYLGIWCRCKRIACEFLIGNDREAVIALNFLRYKPFHF